MVLGTNKSTNVGLAVDDAVGLIKNPEIKAQLSFLSAFGKRYWTREYNWIQHKDDISKLEGHSCHEVLLNVFCCHSTLSKLSQDWENDPAFSVCKSLVNDLSSVVPDGSKYKSEKDSTKSRITDFFKVYIEGFNLESGFKRWITSLSTFNLGSTNKRAVHLFAKHLMSLKNSVTNTAQTSTNGLE